MGAVPKLSDGGPRHRYDASFTVLRYLAERVQSGSSRALQSVRQCWRRLLAGQSRLQVVRGGLSLTATTLPYGGRPAR